MALRHNGGSGRRGHELFSGYTDVEEIGVGSLAVVYRARESGTQRLVALKLLNVRDASPRSIESFERESIALGALSSHPNIVTLYRTFRTPDGRPVLVLELCPGAVADRLRDGAGLPVPDVVAIGIRIAGALETAHRAGILHRDVKPQNILITEFGEPALADFGVAMLQSATQTTAGLFDFTTLHAAPELLEGTGTSAATDVYELASSLYQLIAGQSAFRAYEGESPASVILRILRDPVRPLRGAGVPVALSDLLIRAMSKDKDERPPTAAEFAAELGAIESTQGWPRTEFPIRAGELPGPAGSAWSTPRLVAAGVAAGDSAPAPAAPSAPVAPPAPAVPPAPALPLAPAVPPAPAAPAVPDEQPSAAPSADGRIPVAIDDEFLPPGGAHGTPGYAGRYATSAAEPPPVERTAAEPPPVERTPVEQTPVQPRPVEPPPVAVPVWAVRPPADTEVVVPDLPGDLALDPMSLRPRATVRAGASAVTVDAHGLRLRTWWRRRAVPWSDVQGFELETDLLDPAPTPGGQLIALTALGPVELPGTRRPPTELRYVHALFEAYRLRALALANR